MSDQITEPQATDPETIEPQNAEPQNAGTGETGLGRNTRRALLVAGGTAAVGAVAAVAAAPAEAANGSAVLLGRTNASSAATTINSTQTSGAVIATTSQTAAAGAFFTSKLGNGFAGGSYSASGAGVSARNYSASTGNGAAVVAQGGANSGVIASSASPNRFAARLANTAPTAVPQATGGLLSDGGLGDGTVGLTSGDPSVYSGAVGVHYAGGAGVLGLGGVGVEGYTAENDGWAVHALADGSDSHPTMPTALVVQVINGSTDAIHATGIVRIKGDVFVEGQIHTSAGSVDTGWTPVPFGITKVKRNALRAAAKARSSLAYRG